jgi:hypothetical protein
MSKYWRWCARRGGRCVKPDHADAFSHGFKSTSGFAGDQVGGDHDNP